MKVTVCQFNPAEDTLDQALDRLSEHLVKHGSDFLLLPEMCFADGWPPIPCPTHRPGRTPSPCMRHGSLVCETLVSAPLSERDL